MGILPMKLYSFPLRAYLTGHRMSHVWLTQLTNALEVGEAEVIDSVY